MKVLLAGRNAAELEIFYQKQKSRYQRQLAKTAGLDNVKQKSSDLTPFLLAPAKGNYKNKT
ncbi:MAG TPA: hypothetical protein VLB84_01060 [Bacteroidia bacterium]|nr:hypothetical protein [Bacteroidia bacterium]